MTMTDDMLEASSARYEQALRSVKGFGLLRCYGLSRFVGQLRCNCGDCASEADMSRLSLLDCLYFASGSSCTLTLGS